MAKIVNITIIVENIGVMVHKSNKNIYSSVTFNKKIADAADPLHTLGTILFSVMDIDITQYNDSEVELTKLKPIMGGLCKTQTIPFIVVPKTMQHITVSDDETLSIVDSNTILENTKKIGFYSSSTIDVINYLNERCIL